MLETLGPGHGEHQDGTPAIAKLGLQKDTGLAVLRRGRRSRQPRPPPAEPAGWHVETTTRTSNKRFSKVIKGALHAGAVSRRAGLTPKWIQEQKQKRHQQRPRLPSTLSWAGLEGRGASRDPVSP